jgi:hypothetical protein
MQQLKSPRVLMLLGGAAIVLLVVLFSSGKVSLTGGGSVNMPNNAGLSNVFATAVPYGDDSLVLSNGRALVSYNFKTGKSSQVSKDDVRPNLGNAGGLIVSPDKRYVLFYEDHADARGVLGDILSQDGTNLDASLWWMYDTKTETYHHFQADVSMVEFDGNNAYALQGSSDNHTIVTYTLPELQQTASIKTPKLDNENFFVGDGGFILQTSGNVLFTKDGITSDQLFSGVSIQGFLKDKRYAIGTTNEDDKSQLVLLDMKNRTQTTIDDKVSSQVAINGDNVLYATTSGNNTDNPRYVPSIYNHATGDIKAIKFNAKTFRNTSLLPEAILNDKTVIVSNDSHINVLLSVDQLTSPKQPPTDYQKTITNGNHVIDLEYFQDERAFLVTIYADQAQKESQMVYDQLAKDGYNPALFEIRFSLFTPPPVTPNPGN